MENVSVAEKDAAGTNRVPIARSPIRQAPPVRLHQGWEVSACQSSAPLRLVDLSPLAKVLVRTPPSSPLGSALGVEHGRAQRDSSRNLVIGSGPDDWYVFAPVGTVGQVIARLETIEQPELATVIDNTHNRALVRLSGAQSAVALSKEWAVDLSDRRTPNGCALRSSFAGLVVDLIRDDLKDVRSYLLHCERSSGQFLFDALLHVGTELGIEQDGFPEPEI
jgi:heterotetrameric sarcosine oxidase gamma subunit